MPKRDAGAASGAGGLAGFGRYAGPATLILSSLAGGAKHGYALTKDVEEFAGVRLAPGAVAHAAALAGLPVRVAAGYSDPSYPGVQAMARALPKSATVYFGNGCHTDPFFESQEPPSLAFLARHLTATR